MYIECSNVTRLYKKAEYVVTFANEQFLGDMFLSKHLELIGRGICYFDIISQLPMQHFGERYIFVYCFNGLKDRLNPMEMLCHQNGFSAAYDNFLIDDIVSVDWPVRI